MIFLVWLFLRHRDRFRWTRNILVLLTGSCLLIQMVPVAPPRMLTDQGFVDSALLYGQSVYGPFGSGTRRPAVRACRRSTAGGRCSSRTS